MVNRDRNSEAKPVYRMCSNTSMPFWLGGQKLRKACSLTSSKRQTGRKARTQSQGPYRNSALVSRDGSLVAEGMLSHCEVLRPRRQRTPGQDLDDDEARLRRVVWNGNPRTQANVAIRVVAQEAVSNRILVSYGVVLGRAGAVRVQPQAWEEAMKSLALKVQRFLVSEDGPTAVEYAVMLALIIIVCLTAISAVGSSARAQFQNIATQIDGAN